MAITAASLRGFRRSFRQGALLRKAVRCASRRKRHPWFEAEFDELDNILRLQRSWERFSKSFDANYSPLSLEIEPRQRHCSS
jgi:hypothetical protein